MGKLEALRSEVPRNQAPGFSYKVEKSGGGSGCAALKLKLLLAKQFMLCISAYVQ